MIPPPPSVHPPWWEEVSSPDALDGEARLPAIIDGSAYAVIYVRFWRRVLAMMQYKLGKGDAEDATQEAFLRVWRGRAAFDSSRFTVWAWVYGIARHVALDYRAQQLRQMKAEQAAVSHLADPVNPVEATTEVEALITALPSDTRRMIVLHFGLGYTYQEVGEQLGLPEARVAKRIERMRRSLLADTADRRQL